MEYKLAKDGFAPPARVLITSDDSVIEYVRTIPKNKNNPQTMYVYKFVESLSKKDVVFLITPEQLAAQLSNFFKII